MIWNLAHEDSVRTTIRQLGGLKPLIDLLSNNDPLIRFNTVRAWARIVPKSRLVARYIVYDFLLDRFVRACPNLEFRSLFVINTPMKSEL